MLDRDLAEMYGVQTKALNQAVKRNIERFPEDFMFQLKLDEWTNLKSQFVTSSWGGVRNLPYVLEELSAQNDINEEPAMQLELINQSLAELQMKKKREEQPRNPIGFIQSKR